MSSSKPPVQLAPSGNYTFYYQYRNLKERKAGSIEFLPYGTSPKDWIKHVESFCENTMSPPVPKGQIEAVLYTILTDNRLWILKQKYFENLHVLDVGCSTGLFSLALACKFQVASMHGIDIDSKLINLARENLKSIIKHASHNRRFRLVQTGRYLPQVLNGATTPDQKSPMAPLSLVHEPKYPQHLWMSWGRYVLDHHPEFAKQLDPSLIQQFSQHIPSKDDGSFPIKFPFNCSFEHKPVLGFPVRTKVPLENKLMSSPSPAQQRPVTVTPLNVPPASPFRYSPKSADDSTDDSEGAEKKHPILAKFFEPDNEVLPTYDTVTCFSVTKWIHLNFGDEGIHRLFDRVSRMLKKGGYFILEPQEFKTYQKGFRELKRSMELCKSNATGCFHPKFGTFPRHMSQLEIKPKDFSSILIQDYGFKLVETFTPTINLESNATEDDIFQSKIGRPLGFQRSIYVYEKL